MMVTRDLRAKLSPDVTLALAQTIQRDLAYPGRKRILHYRLRKPAARELQQELTALWMLYHNAERLTQWVRHLATSLPRGDLARQAIASELRSTRREMNRIRHSREGD